MEETRLSVGQRVKDIRKQQKKTLQHLAEETGLSAAYLSNLERNIISPTLDQLQRVCFSLNINITDLLSQGENTESPVVKKNERKLFFSEGDKVKYEMLCDGKHDIEGICITTQHGFNYERTSWGHEYDEIAVVTQGAICVEMLGQEYYLYEGDSIYIKKNTLHTFKNIGDEPCVSYWFYKKK